MNACFFICVLEIILTIACSQSVINTDGFEYYILVHELAYRREVVSLFAVMVNWVVYALHHDIGDQFRRRNYSTFPGL